MKYICTVCGWTTEADVQPEKCPICGATTFTAQESNGEKTYACEHKIGDGKVEDKEIMDGLLANFNGECCPEIAEAYKRYAFEEAEHAAKFAELLGDVVTNSTKKNLEMRAAAEQGACEGKLMIAKRAKELGYDAIHDTVHEMAKDEARHGRGLKHVTAEALTVF